MVGVNDEPEGDEAVDESDDTVAAGVEQFQKAAIDALRAARAMLDAAESIVQDPKAIESVVSTVAGIARDATQTVAGFAAGAARNAARRDPESAEGDDDTGFQTIDID